MTRALQSKDSRYAVVLGKLGHAALDVPVVDTKAPVSIDIPADWDELHWSRQVKLAEEIAGDAFEAADGDTKAAKAKFIIEDELARRA